MFRKPKWIEDAKYAYFKVQNTVYLCLPTINVLISMPYRADWYTFENVNKEPWVQHRSLEDMQLRFREHVADLMQACYCKQDQWKCDFCTGSKKPPKRITVDHDKPPLPGDWVEIVENDDTIAPKGTQGVIDGRIDLSNDEFLVIFNPNPAPFRDEKYVSTSGGPGHYIKTKDLVKTSRVETKPFWCWKDMPRADGGRNYRAPVRVWEWRKQA